MEDGEFEWWVCICRYVDFLFVNYTISYHVILYSTVRVIHAGQERVQVICVYASLFVDVIDE